MKEILMCLAIATATWSTAEAAITLNIYENSTGGITFSYSGSLTATELEGFRVVGALSTNWFAHFENIGSPVVENFFNQDVGSSVADSLSLSANDISISGASFSGGKSTYSFYPNSVASGSSVFGFFVASDLADPSNSFANLYLPTLNNDGTIMTPGVSADYLAVEGAANFTESLGDFGFVEGDSFTLTNSSNGATLLTTAITAAPVPEPSAFLLSSFGSLWLLCRKRRASRYS